MTFFSKLWVYNQLKGGDTLEQTVYLDLYFITNFLMDVLCLKISAKIMSEKSKNSRAILAGIIGALYSVLAITVIPKGFIYPATWIITAFLMVKIAIPSNSFTDTAGGVLAYFLSSGLSGGIIEGVNNVFNGIFNVKISHNITSLLLSVSGLLAFIPFSRKFKSTTKLKNLKIKLGILGNEYPIECMIDSGNLAREPISGLEIMILSKKASCFEKAKKIIDEKALPFYCINVSTIGGSKLLYGIRPDYISFQDKKTSKIIICPDEVSDFCGCDAILPSGIF